MSAGETGGFGGDMRLCGDIPTHHRADRRHHGLGLGFLEAGFLERPDGLVGVEC